MPARQYRSTVEAKTLNQAITNVSSSIVLNSVTTLPSSYPYTLVIDPDTLTEEIVTVTSSAGGNSLNVTRGQDGTTAQAHNLAAAVRHMITARDLQEPQDHINNGGYHVIVCTSTTRPASPVDGQHIYETDTDKTLSWDGTAWNPVSGAAAYQASAPANPSVGSLWVDSDETASQLNTNDFLLKADASASTGYVSKVGGDTVVASGAAVKPLILKGAASQSANLQEWQDSTGAVVASVSPTGNVVGAGMTLIGTYNWNNTSTFTIDNVFTTTYDEYRIIVNQSAAAAYSSFSANPRSGGSDISANLSSSFIYQSGTSMVVAQITGWRVADFAATANGGSATIEMRIFNPMNTTYHTTYVADSFFPDSSTTSSRLIGSGSWRVTTQMEGIKFTTTGGNSTAKIQIYGMRKS